MQEYIKYEMLNQVIIYFVLYLWINESCVYIYTTNFIKIILYANPKSNKTMFHQNLRNLSSVTGISLYCIYIHIRN